MNKECQGGFRVRMDDDKIHIDHPDGKCSMMSSADGGGYFENIDNVSLVKDISNEKGFAIKVSADIKSASLSTMEFRTTHVTALAIADPRSCETDDYAVSVILMVDADLPQATMARSIITVTEAITCSFQQLMLEGYDPKNIRSKNCSLCVTILTNTDCGKRLHNAGKHSKLGELIGKASINAIMSSMNKNGITAEYQTHVLKRLERLGVTKDSFRDYVESTGGIAGELFWERLDLVSSDSSIIASVSAVIQIMDEISWGLIPLESGYEIGHKIICATIFDVEPKEDLINEIIIAIADKAISDSDQ